MADPRQVTKSFTIMGSSFINGASTLIDRLKPGQPLKFARQPNNPADSNAIVIMWGSRGLGWVPRQLAAQLAPLMDAGVEVIVRKAPPLPSFGAYRGILELAYIPPADAPTAAATETADASRGIPKGENFPDDFDE